MLLEMRAPPALVAATGLRALVGVLRPDQVSLSVVLVGGGPALRPVPAHRREAAVGRQAPQHDVSADLLALLKLQW